MTNLLPFDIETAVAHPERVRLESNPFRRAKLVTKHGDSAVVTWLELICGTSTAVYVPGPTGLRIDTNLRLTPPPPKLVERWVNVYADRVGFVYESAADSDRLSEPDRIGYWHIVDPMDGSQPTIERVST